jgi:FG-GAP-like repeat
MIRIGIRMASKPGLRTLVFATVVACAVFAPAGRLWAAGPPAMLGAMPAVGSGAEDPDGDAEAMPLMAVGDFNRDGIADIAEADSPAGDHSGLGSLTVSLGQANGTYLPMAFHLPLGHAPRSIAAGDFNGDGIQDLVVGDDSGALMLFLGDGTGKLVPAGEIAHLDSVASIAVADFNHDGIPDIAVSDWRGNSVTVLLGEGKGSYRRGWSFPLPMRGKVARISTADFNGDGIPDLAVVYDDDAGATFEVMLGNGNGTFTDAPALSFSKDPNAHCAT